MRSIFQKRSLLLFCAWLFGSLSVTAQTGQSIKKSSDIPTQRLERELQRISTLAKGKVGICALHLESGKQVSLNIQERFPMASTVKVAIAVQLFTLIEQGKLSLMTMVDLQPSDLHPGSGTLDVLFAKPGVQLSVQNLLELMMVISDNSATDILLRLVGGTEAVQKRVNALGIQGMSVDRTIIQLLADLDGITLPPANQWTLGFYARLDSAITPDIRQQASRKLATDPRDTSTPEAMVNLLAQIYRGTALKPDSRALLLGVMERCRGGVARLKGYLPPNTVIAHKTGSLNNLATDDVGIITLPDEAGHIAIAVFVGDSPMPLAEREQVIAQSARAIYDYFLYQPTTVSNAGR
ncbi:MULTISPECIES: class A beta-lactamase [unclassified Spirosoma]|uniref:class A beta-lactamase n=1 Tax=unclassified Spirosoma TaxID=2621999 RepID=UPI000964F231|nr:MULTISPECIES: class A beta-lactamase [unclassified Spirosoma]MBN8823808.1 class A beta-lactamase [Spirosoma sp.]OJW79795.1 MAG: serine hydrolase [Spirosoma sp. 48-14]